MGRSVSQGAMGSFVIVVADPGSERSDPDGGGAVGGAVGLAASVAASASILRAENELIARGVRLPWSSSVFAVGSRE